MGGMARAWIGVRVSAMSLRVVLHVESEQGTSSRTNRRPQRSGLQVNNATEND